MRCLSFAVVGFVLCVALGVADIAAAQPVAPPTIHRVTVQPDTGVLTITGAGLGPDMFVSVDGHSVTVLAGATDTQVEVMAPATLLTTPGTYRLTVMDPVRQIGDWFVVASPVASVAVAGSGTPDPSSSGAAAAVAAPRAAMPGAAPVTPVSVAKRTAVSPYLIENGSNTAVGVTALFLNTTGTHNTASGHQALYYNTTGNRNTASGAGALAFNSTGIDNTASGYYALFSNTTGAYNTASGTEALVFNTGGTFNTASGAQALYSNTTGGLNTALGYQALYKNTIGGYNTASGLGALHDNTIGSFNTADGFMALYATTTGNSNTASGHEALRLNTTGSGNTSAGRGALGQNTTGGSNTAVGGNALYQSTGSSNAALGFAAGYNVPSGSYNVFLGADVVGSAADANTMRLGLPYSGGAGQNRTFIAGIHGTQVTGSYLPVVVSASGQLGTLTPAVLTSGPAALVTPTAVEQQLEEQRAVNAAQQATIEDLLARLARLEAASRAARRP